MKVLLLTFTGTGHTRICGDFIKKYFLKEGHEVDHYIYSIDNPLDVDIKSYDILGIGYPIHAFNVPEAFVKFLKKLPVVDNIPYFIYKVSGEPFSLNNASSYHIVKKLKRKGYNKISEKHFLMPYNIMFRYKDSIAKQMYLYLDSLSNLFVKEILNQDYETIKYNILQIILSFLLRIEWIAPKVNAPLSHMKKSCINCNICLNNCPQKAIYINKKGKMKFKSSRCTMCMRCTMNCPKNAISFGIMNAWKVNGPFKFDELIENREVNPEYINHETKGYFRKFNKYFDHQKDLLIKYKINNPIEDYLSR